MASTQDPQLPSCPCSIIYFPVENNPALIRGTLTSPKIRGHIIFKPFFESPTVKALLGQEKLQPSSPRPPPAPVVFPWKSSQRKTQGLKKNLVFIKTLECEGFCSFQWGFDSYR